MKQFRNTFLLLGLFVLLLLIVVFFTSDGAQQRRDEKAEMKPLLPSSVVDSMTKVIFARQGDELILERSEGGEWKLGNLPVDQDEQKKLLEVIDQLPRGKVVSRAKTNWVRYGLGDDAANTVTLLKGDEQLAKLFIGGSGPTYKQVYLRWDEEDQVRLVETELHLLSSYDLTRWRDKRVVAVDQSDIVAVIARVGEERWSFKLENSKWIQVKEAESAPEIDQQKMTQYVKDLLDLKAVSFETDLKKFTKADNALALTLEDGTEVIVSVSKKAEGEFYAQVTGQTELMRLNSDLSARLRPSFLTENTASPSDSASVQE